jgi:hypothetical protein
MWNQWGRTANRQLTRKSWLPIVERLEPRCVLNGGSLSTTNDIAPFTNGKIDSDHSAVVSGDHADHSSSSGFGGNRSGTSAGPSATRSYNSAPSNLAVFASLEVGSYLLVGQNFIELIVVTPVISGGNAVTAFAVASTSEGGPNLDASHINPKVNADSISRPTTVAAVANTFAVQSSDLAPHSNPQVAFDPSANAAIPGSPPAPKMPSANVVNQPGITTVHATGVANVNGVVQQNGAAAAYDTLPMEELFVVNPDMIAQTHESVGAHKGAIVKGLPDDFADWPVHKASLVGLPLNIKGVQRALDKVMGELGHLGTAFSSWLDAQHLTGVAAAVTVVTIGGGTAVYLRRRGSKQSRKRDDEEASSSWLFARLLSVPDAP